MEVAGLSLEDDEEVVVDLSLEAEAFLGAMSSGWDVVGEVIGCDAECAWLGSCLWRRGVNAVLLLWY